MPDLFIQIPMKYSTLGTKDCVGGKSWWCGDVISDNPSKINHLRTDIAKDILLQGLLRLLGLSAACCLPNTSRFPVLDFRLGVGNDKRYVIDEPGESTWMALAMFLNLNVRRREVWWLKVIDFLPGGNGIRYWLANLAEILW